MYTLLVLCGITFPVRSFGTGLFLSRCVHVPVVLESLYLISDTLPSRFHQVGEPRYPSGTSVTQNAFRSLFHTQLIPPSGRT